MTNTVAITKSVRFATVLTTQTFSYPRVDAVDIVNVYYQDSDYKRFREERWLESLRQSHAEERLRANAAEKPQQNKRLRRHDNMLKFGRNSRGKVQHQGAALAA